MGSMLVDERLIELNRSETTGVIGAYETCVLTTARQPISRSACVQSSVEDAQLVCVDLEVLKQTSTFEALRPRVAADAIAWLWTAEVV
jgi:hypothetical protein